MEEQQGQPLLSARGKTMWATGAVGGVTAVANGFAHGPAAGTITAAVTAFALFLESHGNVEEYATVAQYAGAVFHTARRRIARQRSTQSPALPKDATVEEVQRQMDTYRSGSSLQNNGTSLSRPALDFTASDVLAAPVDVPTVPFTFSSVLRTFKPTLSNIYLGTLPSGKFATLKARDLCHTALAGSTRGGKDHLIRMLMSQLCVAGANVYLLNPHYTRYDLETLDPYGKPYPEDWTPFEQWLKNDPRELIPQAKKYKVIEHYLRLAFEMVGDRLEIYGNSEEPLGAPQFLVVNELPAVIDEVPRAAHYLKRILREGAKVGVFLVNASQDFQVATTFKEIGGGIRKCYRTAYDVGADNATQDALGLLKEKGLGKGRSSIRCDDYTSPLFVPYVDNEALYVLLGPSTYVPSQRQGVESQDTSLRPPSLSGEKGVQVPAVPGVEEYVAAWYCTPQPSAQRLARKLDISYQDSERLCRMAQARHLIDRERSRNAAVPRSRQARTAGTVRERLAEPDNRGVPGSYGNDGNTGTGAPVSVKEDIEITSEEREQIIRLRKYGIPRREICGLMGKGKHFYEAVKHVCDEGEL